MPVLLKEPIFWFLLIGTLLFGVDHLRRTDVITVDDALRNRIAGLWQTQMGRAPSDNELRSLTDAWLREEVLYREAVRLGLAEEDIIIRRRLVQKLSFLVQDVSEETFSQKEIQDYYRDHAADYTLPTRFTFSQIFLQDPDRANEVREKLAAGVAWQGLGDQTLLSKSYVSKTEREVSSSLGKVFTSQLDQLVERQWVGPVSSSFGHHLVRLERLTPPEVTPLDFIERKVREDMRTVRAEAALDDYLEELLSQHQVVYQ